MQKVATPHVPKSLRSKFWPPLSPSEDGGSVWASCCALIERTRGIHANHIQSATYYSVAYDAAAKRWSSTVLCSLHRKTPRARQWCPLDEAPTLSADGRYETIQVFSDSWRIEDRLSQLILDPQTYGYSSPYLGIFDTFSGKLVHLLHLACRPKQSASASWSLDEQWLGYSCPGGPHAGIYIVSTATWTTNKVPGSEALFDSRFESDPGPLNWSPGSTQAIVEADLCQNAATPELVDQLQADGLNDYGSRDALWTALQHCGAISVAVDLASGGAVPVTPIGPNEYYSPPVYGATDDDLFGWSSDGSVVRFTPTAPGTKVEELTAPGVGDSVSFWTPK